MSVAPAADHAGAGTHAPPVARLRDVSLQYGDTTALDAVDLDVPRGGTVGLIGPDGVGKSSLFALIAGARALQRGRVEVLDGDMARRRHRLAVCPRIAYMPQGLGKNLYPTLSVFENIEFFGRLFGHDGGERRRRIAELLASTGLAAFRDRPAGKLSGGMKQKLGLCCALIHDPDLLILEEPTTGVDPLSRVQFWELIDRIRAQRAGMSVLVATAYMEEAARFDWLVAMDGGRILATGTPAELRARTGSSTLEQAFIALLPEARRREHRPVVIRARAPDGDGAAAIEARDLTMRFGDFVAVDRVSFRIARGEIFGFLGSNGCGKTTTMKMLTGLLPLGQRQRLSLAVAMTHRPEMLILDEPTSGVDPIARDAFWQMLVDLARHDGVTIFISTHFMDEAERCDRVSLMHDGRVLASDTPARLIAQRAVDTLEQAFIAHLRDAAAAPTAAAESVAVGPAADESKRALPTTTRHRFDLRRMLSYSRREALELRRDPIRMALALLGSLIPMLVMGYGITMDVEDLTFAVLDRDQTTTSRDYVSNIAGSRYFSERAPIADYTELDRRMRAGEIGLALEIPPGFARDLARGRPVEIGAWIDGAMPQRAETIRGYVRGMHQQWLADMSMRHLGQRMGSGLVNIEVRFRYNPDVKSLVAMVPAVIPLLLMLIPAMLTALSVVREKELGSIINLYVTPVTRLEFLLGKQLPYVVLAMINFFMLALLAVTLFGVPFTGSLPALVLAALLYVTASTAIGLLISTFMKSQVAALFGTALLSILPAVQFSGMIDPVASLEGVGRLIGEIYPTAHFLTITRGTFSKALHLADLHDQLFALALAVPVLIGLCALMLKKQER